MIIALTTTSTVASVTAIKADAATALVVGQKYVVASSTNCWIRQGTSKTITCVAQASILDTDFMAITVDGATSTYEFDKAGNGVTTGRVQVNISADTTAITVAARLRTAILATQTQLEVTDNGDGTLTVVAPDRAMTITETVVNAGFTITAGLMSAAAAAGSTYLPANTLMYIDGAAGPQLGTLRDTLDGKASVTRVKGP